MATNLLTFEHAFYTGDFESVINAQVEPSDRVKQLQIRALLAAGQPQAAQVQLNKESAPVYTALKALASKSVADAESVVSAGELDDATKHIVALTYAATGELSRALEILDGTGHSLDASLLKIHILLTLNRDEDAQKVVDATRQWANDHVVFNVGEALTSLRKQDTAQKAYFIFEENNSLHQTANSSLGEAVAQLELRRFPEAGEAIQLALKSETDASVVSALALALIQGDRSEAEALRSKLQLAKYTQSPAVAQLKEKEEVFARICAKYN